MSISEKPAQEVAVEEVETQPVAEVDTVHISPKLLETYQQTCGGCHEKGLVGAPVTGDAEAWKPRLAKGMDTMVKHARDGFNAMPPAGLCFHCSDEDYAALIIYMSTAK
ncbi:cytochrome c5 family protein [Microbulbifer sp. HZ11]|uniref:c-type cytochrome n=1 Tax=unclassified Microbulbifer TaxID=2619833 RepID=UPI0009DFC026|nr:c-type cytochrome [Microbulbifer sp. HZ11]